MMQHEVATNHYKWLKSNANSKKDINEFKMNATFTSNLGKEIIHPITWEWWQVHLNEPFNKFYRAFYHDYYQQYFSIRSFAKQSEDTGFDTKIKESGRYLIIDTTGQDTPKIISRLEKAKREHFHNTIIYLDINVEYSIARDKYRGQSGGREVGVNVIKGYPAKLKSAVSTYESNAKSKNPVVDRIMKFKWKGDADPRKGTWNKVSDKRYSLERTKKKK